ncbi:hydroxyacid dehydrogenase [Microbacterium sp. NPDC056234]|uniref:hydroxyacid dehydrogenase n=1 Tax=Microbacterium sp. NPDC056234 TaxID=3345757 RepID=UPI0035DF36B1
MLGVAAMDGHLPPLLFDDEAAASIRRNLDIEFTDVQGSIAHCSPALLAEVEVLITGWGVAPVGDPELDRMPNLRAIVHAGGGVGWISSNAWRRGLRIASAAAANATPVAEYTFGMILLAAKEVLWVSRRYAREQRHIDREVEYADIGGYGARVGVVGASRVGTKVLDFLKGTDLQPSLYDPFCSAERAEDLGAALVDDIHELAASSRILTLHAPVTAATQGMIGRSVLAAMPDGATLINTARGDLVDQEALLEQIQSGRINAILDVTTPEVLDIGHPFYERSNVFLTPHLSGSAGNELRRLGAAVAENVERLAAGNPLVGEVRAEDLGRLL